MNSLESHAPLLEFNTHNLPIIAAAQSLEGANLSPKNGAVVDWSPTGLRVVNGLGNEMHGTIRQGELGSSSVPALEAIAFNIVADDEGRVHTELSCTHHGLGGISHRPTYCTLLTGKRTVAKKHKENAMNDNSIGVQQINLDVVQPTCKYSPKV